MKVFTTRNVRWTFLSIALSLAATLVAAPQSGLETAPKPGSDKGSIDGLVVKATGQPLRGVRITLRKANATDASGLDSLPGLTVLDPSGRLGFGGNPFKDALGLTTATTDAMGHFSLSDIAPGDYRITAEAEGYLSQEYGQRTPTGPGTVLALEAGKPFTLELRMIAASVISGRVYDAEGEPLLKTPVQAYTYRYNDGRRTLVSIASGLTNDLGEYRLYWLQPGAYFIGVSPRGGPATANNDPPPQTEGARNMQFIAIAANGQGPATFQISGSPGADNNAIYYPGVANPVEAELVHVGVATEAQRIDFHLRPLKTITISGRIIASFSLAPSPVERRIMQERPMPTPGENGSSPTPPAPQVRGSVQIAIQGGAAGMAFPPGAGLPSPDLFLAGGPPIELTLTRAGAASAGPLGRNSTPVRPDGTFQFENVTSGAYSLIAIAKAPNGKQHSAQIAIDAGNADIRDLILALEPGHDIAGRITVDPPPNGFKMTNLKVNLTPDSAPVNMPPLGGGDFVMAIATPGGVFPGGDAISATVAEDGSFLLKDVATALGYRLRVTGIPPGGYLMDGQIGSADALGAPLSGADPEASLRLQVGFSGGAVSGTVIDPSGTLYATAVVALVPAKTRSGRTDLYFSTSSDSTGRYSFSNVPPGPYRLFAWTEIPSGAYRSPEFLANYEERGLLGAVEKRGAWTETLKVIQTSQP